MAKEINRDQLNLVRQTTAGKNGGFIRLGDVVICFGRDNVANSGTTIQLPYTYSSDPWSVVATIRDANNQTAWVTGIATGTITLKQLYATTALSVSWVVIGPA